MFIPLIAKVTAAAKTATAATTTTVTTASEVMNATATTTNKIEGSLWSHLFDADPIVQMTLLLLIGFSVTCWALIFFKSSQLRKAQKSAQSFWQKFSATGKMAEIINVKSLRNGPLYEIFATGHSTLGRFKQSNISTMSEHHRNILNQRISQSREEEVYKLEQYVSFLATTASVAPFIGLFGTVWGILTAFMEIGKSGSSSLATVGPYISEALVATAIGLFAAIPAVIFYNYFVNKIKVINKLIDLFIEDFIIKSDQELTA